MASQALWMYKLSEMLGRGRSHHPSSQRGPESREGLLLLLQLLVPGRV